MLRTIPLVLAIILASGVAEACTRAMPAAARTHAVPAGNLDQRLLDTAVLAEVNYVRCRNGRGPLSLAGASLRREAQAHSRWMARRGRLSHESNVAGRRTLSDRIKAAGIRIRTGAENIGSTSLYQIENGPFRILNASACQFATYGGQPLPPHTYESLARHMVASLMTSAGHRRNILDSRMGRMSTGAHYDASAPYCGRIWYTQDFVN